MMTKNRQKLIWFTLLLISQHVISENTSPENTEDLTQAEAKDGQLDIIKTIKKINDDGSYTIGYEADDGSFKIESRDVLGNVKGTYGYLDETGEIKRVTYSTSNLTDILSEAPSVVQRIPKTNKTYSSTRRPNILVYNPTTPSTPTNTSVIQAIPKRRITTHTTTTTTSPNTTTHKSDRPSYGEYVKNSAEVLKSTTSRPTNIVYATSVPPRNILYQRSLLRSTIAPHSDAQKSEGQIIRPEVVTGRPTELPVFRRLALKNSLADAESPTVKPVTEEPEVRGNLLRRQLSQEKTTTFDPRQHVITLQQGLGDDAIDVYSASLTTGTPRPLFTTTIRPRLLQSPQVVLEKSTPRYHINTPISPQIKQQTTTEYIQEATTTEPAVSEANTPSPSPAYQIPPVQPENVQSPLVAVKHPFHGGVVLVPLHQLRLQEHSSNQPQYIVANNQYYRTATPTPTPTPEYPQSPAPVFIQRPPILRSIPVHVDENGYVRPLPPQIVTPTPHSAPVHITPPTPIKYINNDVQNDVDGIRPPVSTKDFQKLIELLILRQRKLEQVNALLNAQHQRDLLQQHRFRLIPHPTPVPILLRTPQEINQNGPVTFIPEHQLSRTRQYVTVPQMQIAEPQEQTVVISPRPQETRQVYVQEAPVSYTPTPTSYTPTKRVARLLHSNPPKDQNVNADYLPPQIREMLLLRMLQLAINPALPIESTENEEEDPEPSEQQIKKTGVRNVEVLGEEDDDQKKHSRSKRFRGLDDYYE